MESNAHRWLIVGLGEILWDVLPDGRRVGGAPANFAHHAHALGAETVVVSAVGEDDDGDAIVAHLETVGIDPRYVAIDPDHPTGSVQVELDGDGTPHYTIAEDVAWDHIPFAPRLAELAARADVVSFGTLCQRGPDSRGTVLAFLDATRHHCLRIYDVNLRQIYFDQRTVHNSLKRANVLKLSDEELTTIAGLLEIEASEEGALAELAARYSLLLIVLTHGAGGSRLFAPLENAHHPGFSTPVVDTVGAGDSFTAAVAIGLLHGWTLDVIGDRANRLATYVCAQSGATPAIPAEFSALFRPPGT